MNISISCRCGSQFVIPKNKVSKLSSFSCPVCNRQMPTEHLEKVKKCLTLIDDCHCVHAPKIPSSGIVDLGYEFTINFVE